MFSGPNVHTVKYSVPQKNISVKRCDAYSVGTQKHFVRVEISGFDLPNRFSGQTTLLSSRADICNLSRKLNNLDAVIIVLLRIESGFETCQLRMLQDSRIPGFGILFKNSNFGN